MTVTVKRIYKRRGKHEVDQCVHSKALKRPTTVARSPADDMEHNAEITGC